MIKIITLKDINKAIVTQTKDGLKGTTFETIKFASTDIREGIERPSFFIDFTENKTSRLNAFNKERNAEVEVYYFAKTREKAKLELLEVQEQLEKIFLKCLKVNEEFYIPINEANFSISKEEGYLVMTIELYTVESIEDTEVSEFMEEINLNNNTRS